MWLGIFVGGYVDLNTWSTPRGSTDTRHYLQYLHRVPDAVPREGRNSYRYLPGVHHFMAEAYHRHLLPT